MQVSTCFSIWRDTKYSKTFMTGRWSLWRTTNTQLASHPEGPFWRSDRGPRRRWSRGINRGFWIFSRIFLWVLLLLLYHFRLYTKLIVQPSKRFAKLRKWHFIEQTHDVNVSETIFSVIHVNDLQAITYCIFNVECMHIPTYTYLVWGIDLSIDTNNNFVGNKTLCDICASKQQRKRPKKDQAVGHNDEEHAETTEEGITIPCSP